jgi:hypothetical protein
MAQKYRTLQVGVLDEGVLGVAIDGRRRFGEARPVQAHSLRCCAIPGRAVRKIDYAGSGIVAICARGKYGRPLPSLTCHCRIPLRRVPSGSPPTAAGQGSSSRHARPGGTADTADLPG